MKNESNTKKAPILIYQDDEIARFNRETLDTIFEEVESIKLQLLSLDFPFTPETFVKCLTEGTDFITETLYQKLAENFKGMSDKVIQTLTEDEKGKLKKLVIMIEPSINSVKELLNQIGLTPDQVPFDEKDNPVITDELKHFLSEKSKRYATTEGEKELYYAILKFIEVANSLEACLAKNEYPLLFTKYTSFEYPLRNAESDHFAFPLCLADYDRVEEDGFARFVLNPDVFQEFAILKGASEDFKKNRVYNPSYSSNTGEASLHLPKDAGKRIEDFIANPEDNTKLPAGRWKNFPGA